MNTQLPAVISVVALASAVVWCEQAMGATTTWKCFTVDMILAKAPHAEMGDKYCVVRNGAKWYLEPGTGMENWKRIGLGKRIPLEVVTESDRVMRWEFEVKVTNHDQYPPEGDHGNKHRRPDFVLTLQVNIPVDPNEKAEAEMGMSSGPESHDGSAHSNED